MTKHLRTPPDFPLQSPVGLKPPPKKQGATQQKGLGQPPGTCGALGAPGGADFKPLLHVPYSGTLIWGCPAGPEPSWGEQFVVPELLGEARGWVSAIWGGPALLQRPCEPPPSPRCPPFAPPFWHRGRGLHKPMQRRILGGRV